jgi:hypothetical protein
MIRISALKISRLVLISAVGFCVCGFAGIAAAKPKPKIDFDMVPSQASNNANCLQNASGHVEVTSLGPVEVMDVDVTGLPPNTEFDLFVIQHPDGPFGMSWYQGDIDTNHKGRGHGQFVGRFSVETFIVAPGSVSAPQPHDGLDANTNPATLPVHTFHLGLWFNSPTDASNAGCLSSMTPFNGDHTAGVQALSTRDLPPDEGPLGQLAP